MQGHRALWSRAESRGCTASHAHRRGASRCACMRVCRSRPSAANRGKPKVTYCEVSVFEPSSNVLSFANKKPHVLGLSVVAECRSIFKIPQAAAFFNARPGKAPKNAQRRNGVGTARRGRKRTAGTARQDDRTTTHGSIPYNWPSRRPSDIRQQDARGERCWRHAYRKKRYTKARPKCGNKVLLAGHSRKALGKTPGRGKSAICSTRRCFICCHIWAQFLRRPMRKTTLNE